MSASLLTMGAMAAVNYQVVPVPQSIQLDPQGRTFTLTKGQTVSYPGDNAKMKRNAEFVQEYLGLQPQVAVQKTKQPAKVQLTLGLNNENPDAYQITVGKNGVVIQGASESGVFYGIQTLRKSVLNDLTSYVDMPWATISASPRFGYRGCMLDCARHFFPVEFIKTYIGILALHEGVESVDELHEGIEILLVAAFEG